MSQSFKRIRPTMWDDHMGRTVHVGRTVHCTRPTMRDDHMGHTVHVPPCGMTM